MKQAWIVVREEKHIDVKFWVCMDRNDALRIAQDVTKYWREKYEVEPGEYDETCYADQIFHYDAEDAFRVYVVPQKILDAGEDDGNDT